VQTPKLALWPGLNPARIKSQQELNPKQHRLLVPGPTIGLRYALLGESRFGTRIATALAVRRFQRFVGRLLPGGQRVASPAVHEVLAVAEAGQVETFLEHLRRHERCETTYLEMSVGLAQSGIEKWTVDTGRMTMTFCDEAGREPLVEQIG
jgi:hypothetical protein